MKKLCSKTIFIFVKKTNLYFSREQYGLKRKFIVKYYLGY